MLPLNKLILVDFNSDRFYIGHEIDGERNEHVLRVMARG